MCMYFFLGGGFLCLSHLSHSWLEADIPPINIGPWPPGSFLPHSEAKLFTRLLHKEEWADVKNQIITVAENAYNLIERRHRRPFHPMSKLLCMECAPNVNGRPSTLLISRNSPAPQPPWAKFNTPMSGLHLVSANENWSVGSEDVFENTYSGGVAID